MWNDPRVSALLSTLSKAVQQQKALKLIVVHLTGEYIKG